MSSQDCLEAATVVWRANVAGALNCDIPQQKSLAVSRSSSERLTVPRSCSSISGDSEIGVAPSRCDLAVSRKLDPIIGTRNEARSYRPGFFVQVVR